MDTPETLDVARLAATLRDLLGRDSAFYPAQIELRYPRILARIVSLWGQNALDVYLGELMVPDRHDRQGFAPDVAMEVFHLSTIHGALGLGKESEGTGWAGIQDPDQYRKAISKDKG